MKPPYHVRNLLAVPKILWVDVETTGTDPKRNDVIQLATLVEIDGEVVEGYNHFMAPRNPGAVEQVALQINNKNFWEIMKYPPAEQSVLDLNKMMEQYINKLNPKDKFILAGYNARFDYDFLRALYGKVGNKWFGSYIFWPVLDVSTLVAAYLATGKERGMKNYKLGTLCKHFGIPINAHDAMSDIRATKELFMHLLKETFMEQVTV